MTYSKFLKTYTFTILFLTLLSCERDDICAESTPTTPQLSIEFNDTLEPTELKSVSRITIYGEGLVTDPETSSNATLIFNDNTNNILLPLRVETEGIETTARFIFEKDTNLRLDDDTETNSNIDIIEVRYTPQFEYVSRACGFKSIFTNVTVSVVSDDDNWINSILTNTNTVDNENEVHFNILH